MMEFERKSSKNKIKNSPDILNQNNVIILEAKSISLTEQLEKIANVTLSESLINVNNIKNENENYQNQTKTKNHNKENAQNETSSSDTKRNALTNKYFLLWKKNVKNKRTDKIEQFFRVLKTQKEKQINSSHRVDVSSIQITKERHYDDSFKNRFKSQQTIIEAQKATLKKQEKLIEDLKLGIIRDETKQSLENSQTQIREIFKKCSNRIKCKITPPNAVENNVDIIELKSNRAPKILLQMEKRAEERALKRQIILERKKMMDEIKKQEVEEMIKNKKIADEEQRQKNLEAIKEKRYQEAEIEKQRQSNKQKYLANVNKAHKLCNKRLKKVGLEAFKCLLNIKEENELKSELFYCKRIQIKLLLGWKSFIWKKIEQEAFDADLLYRNKLLKKVFITWTSVLTLRKQSLQVAEDLYDMRLESKIFIHWNRYVCVIAMKELKNLHLAEHHYNSRTLLHYFYFWKSLPAVIQLEKAKEDKKKRWREKVLQILPDYKPYKED